MCISSAFHVDEEARHKKNLLYPPILPFLLLTPLRPRKSAVIKQWILDAKEQGTYAGFPSP